MDEDDYEDYEDYDAEHFKVELEFNPLTVDSLVIDPFTETTREIVFCKNCIHSRKIESTLLCTRHKFMHKDGIEEIIFETQDEEFCSQGEKQY